MSRFVHAYKYRHVFGQAAKKEHGYDNVKVSGSAWDTNIVSASGRYISVNWNASGAVPNFSHKLPDVIPLARSHAAPILDTDWSPHNDSIVASGGEDGKVMIWKVESSALEDLGQDHWVLEDFDPVAIGQVFFHPTASNVLTSASSERIVKFWNLADTDCPRSVLTGHSDTIQCLAFNPTGTLIATTCRDKKLRLFDPRAGGEAVRITDAHGGIKGARVVWMGDLDKIATTGFSKMSDRQVSIWEAGGLGSVKTITIDQFAGVVMPFWSDNGILFLGGIECVCYSKSNSDGNIQYYEYESGSLFALAEHKSPDPQGNLVSDCEISRACKVSGSSVEPIAFIMPRKTDSFQSDIYPAVASSESSLSASESVFNGGQSTFMPSAPAPAPTHAPAPTAFSAPPPVTKATPVLSRSELAPVPRPASPVVLTPPTQVDDEGKTTVSEAEVNRLNSELCAAREKIRNMELQVAQALMEA
ncbi:WD40-repeat-containing domain protein [Suillus plorans]|uniref:Coronin n=1 Tax=Suillus plorans TaxID=116603 RepID=A0A9P7DCL5_9AGAM|nr:WD40-repeat-containing domain protein [Suillus plorans]KAG1788632.1 WD40-repeat-containing domain protein [Suillus plorans]